MPDGLLMLMLELRWARVWMAPPGAGASLVPWGAPLLAGEGEGEDKESAPEGTWCFLGDGGWSKEAGETEGEEGVAARPEPDRAVAPPREPCRPRRPRPARRPPPPSELDAELPRLLPPLPRESSEDRGLHDHARLRPGRVQHRPEISGKMPTRNVTHNYYNYDEKCDPPKCTPLELTHTHKQTRERGSDTSRTVW